MGSKDGKPKLQRRDFIKGIGGVAAVGLPLIGWPEARIPIIGVVGGGIVGASIAYHLAEAGAQVTLFEKSRPAKGCTEKSFAMLDPQAEDPEYADLRLRSILVYRQLDNLLDLDITWGGSIGWITDVSAVQTFEEVLNKSKEAGIISHPRIVDAMEFAILASNIKSNNFVAGFYSGLGGHIDPVRTTQRFLDWAALRGANIVYPCEVTDLNFNAGKFVGVATSQGSYKLDRLVIAGGVDTPSLSSQVGFKTPLKHAPGVLAHTTPTKLIEQPVKIVTAPYGGGFKQYPDGRIVASEGLYPPDIPAHQAIRAGYVDMPEPIRQMHGRRILDKLSRILPDSRGVALDKLTLGFRPMPQDGMPIVGFTPNNPDIYLAVMHSGVTLAPIMGQYITQEILSNTLVERLSPYRPNRFFR